MSKQNEMQWLRAYRKRGKQFLNELRIDNSDKDALEGLLEFTVHLEDERMQDLDPGSREAYFQKKWRDAKDELAKCRDARRRLMARVEALEQLTAAEVGVCKDKLNRRNQDELLAAAKELLRSLHGYGAPSIGDEVVALEKAVHNCTDEGR